MNHFFFENWRFFWCPIFKDFSDFRRKTTSTIDFCLFFQQKSFFFYRSTIYFHMSYFLSLLGLKSFSIKYHICWSDTILGSESSLSNIFSWIEILGPVTNAVLLKIKILPLIIHNIGFIGFRSHRSTLRLYVCCWYGTWEHRHHLNIVATTRRIKTTTTTTWNARS